MKKLTLLFALILSGCSNSSALHKPQALPTGGSAPASCGYTDSPPVLSECEIIESFDKIVWGEILAVTPVVSPSYSGAAAAVLREYGSCPGDVSTALRITLMPMFCRGDDCNRKPVTLQISGEATANMNPRPARPYGEGFQWIPDSTNSFTAGDIAGFLLRDGPSGYIASGGYFFTGEGGTIEHFGLTTPCGYDVRQPLRGKDVDTALELLNECESSDIDHIQQQRSMSYSPENADDFAPWQIGSPRCSPTEEPVGDPCTEECETNNPASNDAPPDPTEPDGTP